MMRIAGLLLAGLAPFAGFGQNLAVNPGFEAGTAGWEGFGARISATAGPVHSGTLAAFVENRSGNWSGIRQVLNGVLQDGGYYRISGWVRLASSGVQPVKLTMAKTDGAGTAYTPVAEGAATATGWTRLEGGYRLSVTGALDELFLYVEGPAAAVEYYADDFVIEPCDWRAEANARIEQLRKRDVRIRIVDPGGVPIGGVTVDATQRRHRFGFGSAINGNITNAAYAAFFTNHFEWAVMENEAKWPANEPAPGEVTYAAADEIAAFCRDHGIVLRGHTMFWAVEDRVPPWVRDLADAELASALANRIESAAGHFRGAFAHWDVNNEMLHGRFFADRLGLAIRPWMFTQVRAADPGAVLFVNDFNVVAGTETEAYVQQVGGLLAAGAPVDGIGAQGHFGAAVDPVQVEARIDRLAACGLPIWITEYDSVNADAAVRAENLEALYRTAFSKAAVEGILMWGFWAGAHWRGPDAAIVDLDWAVNEAGRRYQSLLAEWTTRTSGVSGVDGEVPVRGFHGEYDVVLTPPGGRPTLRRFSLGPGTGPQDETFVVHFTAEQPVLHDLRHPDNGNPGGFSFRLTGDAGQTYEIARASRLDPPDWTPVGNLYNPGGTVAFTNAAPADHGPAFFRARAVSATP